MQQALSDANPEARQYGRRTFLLWQKLSPADAENLFVMLDYAVQKAILEEREFYQDEFETRNPSQNDNKNFRMTVNQFEQSKDNKINTEKP